MRNSKQHFSPTGRIIWIAVVCLAGLRLAQAVPQITTQPSNEVVAVGQDATFSVVANGSSPLQYQWRGNGTNINRGTNSSLTLVSVGPQQNGTLFDVIVRDLTGMTTSMVARLTVMTPPVITTQPQSRTVNVHSNVTFFVMGNGSPPLSYQWRFNDVELPPATNAFLTITNVESSDAGVYSVVVSNPVGRAVSSNAMLVVNSPPTITQQPESQTVRQGDNVTLAVIAMGSAPLSYQWRHGTTGIVSGTNSTLILQQIQPTQAGDYFVIVSNPGGSVASEPARITVLASPVIISQPTNQAVIVGNSASFHVEAGGTQPLFYQWRFNGTNIMDATNATVVVPAVPGNEGSYSVIISNSVGTAESMEALLEILYPPRITEQPRNQMAAQGTAVTFSITASGTMPLHFQWYFNGGVIMNATNAALTLSGVTASSAGQYLVVVSNIAGTAPSVAATLAIGSPPAITTQPQSNSVPRGSDVLFTVEAEGSDPLNYQWLFKGAAIEGATNAVLSLHDVRPMDAGGYAVVVANPFGTVTSSVALLQVYLGDLAFADNFADAVTVSDAYLSGRANNTNATREPLEPRHDDKRSSHSVWLRWVAPASGIVVMNTFGSDFDTLLAVYAGQSLDTLNPMDSDDDSGPGNTSSVIFNADAGVAYYIAVAGYNGAAGNIVFEADLTITSERVPRFLSQPRSRSVLAGENVTLNANYSTDVPVAVEWEFNSLFAANTTIHSVTNVDETKVGQYRVRLSTTNRALYSHIAELQINASGHTNVLAHDKLGDSIDAGHLPGNIGGGPPGFTRNGRSRRTGGSSTHGYTTTQTFSTVGSQSEPGEPQHCGIGAGHSYWYSYQAEDAGTLHITTDGSTFDTVLAVYIGPGDSFETLTNVACDNNSGLDGHDSDVRFPATGGVIYYIVVDGVTNVSPQTGTVKLHINLGEPVTIVAPPQSQTVPSGTNIAFSVTADGMTNYTYQWRFNGGNISGATNATLIRNNVQASQAGNYDVVVNNPINSTTSSVAVLTVYSSTLNITNQPQSQSVLLGGNVSFSVGTTGAGVLSYQWRFNGTNIFGATNSTLTLLNVQLASAGAYSVNVTDVNGSRASSNAMLAVLVAPTITLQPASITAAPGANVTLTATAAGTPTPSLQWYFNGSAVSGATSASLLVTNCQQANEGSYFMRASNVAGSADTLNAEVFLNAPLRITNAVCSTGIFSGRVIGVVNSNYILQVSTDAVSWSSLVTNRPASGMWSFSDPCTNSLMRMYRVIGTP